ncbi:polysaccharide deacetylase family protein [Sporosarcina luteola]|uniref:polysaccharide deacetylase family protein n=1 Tax=Sporosarcina luteola TaxID=582850 RepID=UPI00203F5BE3|nr:polysaccharide deacetylase family protein [Sporosarcina luteola]MCM3711798.1 polysaccharide deacetylase family protein [Sporosarcina luteola]
MNRKRQNARSVWIDITFSTAIVLLTVSAILLVFMTENGSTASQPDEKETTSSIPVETEQIDSNYPGIKIITKTSNDKNAPYAIQYPQSIHTIFNTEVKNYIEEVQDRYLETIIEKKRLDEKTSGELNVSYETLPHASGNYSFVFLNSSSFSDSESGKMEIRSFHLNPETGESFSIRDLFAGDSNRLQTLASSVRRAIQKDDSLQEHIIEDALEKYTEPRWMNYRNFAITDDALIIYFDENTIADRLVGPPIVSVPIDAIDELLASAFKPEDVEDAIESPNQGSMDSSNEEQNDGHSDKSTESDIEGDEQSKDSPLEGTVGKKVALTFDDGPDPKVTRQILEILQKHDAKATFFMLGSRVEYYSDIVNEMKEAGHELGNHTWNHADLTKLSPERIAKEIDKTSAIIEDVTGQKVEAFRPPYGAVNDAVHNITGLPIVLWDVDTQDWKYRDSARILQVVKENVKDGSIILMHDIHQSTADGLDAVLTYLKNEGFEFVTVKELEETTP